MLEITATQIGIIIGIISIIATIFGVFFYFQKPQITFEKRLSLLEDQFAEMQEKIKSIMDDHSKSTEAMQKDMKDLTGAINGLNITVAKLETMIDERIPRASATLTPPGQ